MSTDTKTNERPGVRARLGSARFSAYKAREVLDLIRGRSVAEARSILEFTERGASEPIMKLLDSAVANAANNNDIPPEELYVGACYADEGPTLKRWRPRARGRATRIRKRTCHITIVVSRYTPAEMDTMRARAESRGRVSADARSQRARRVARSRGAEEVPAEEPVSEEKASEETVSDETVSEEVLDRDATEHTVSEAFAEDAGTEADSEDAETGDDVAEDDEDDATDEVAEGDDGDTDDEENH